jgi:hypothetical protein
VDVDPVVVECDAHGSVPDVEPDVVEPVVVVPDAEPDVVVPDVVPEAARARAAAW